MLYKKKKGSQQAIKLPIIKPRIRVARRSFFLAILLRSFSASYVKKIAIIFPSHNNMHTHINNLENIYS